MLLRVFIFAFLSLNLLMLVLALPIIINGPLIGNGPLGLAFRASFSLWLFTFFVLCDFDILWICSQITPNTLVSLFCSEILTIQLATAFLLQEFSDDVTVIWEKLNYVRLDVSHVVDPAWVKHQHIDHQFEALSIAPLQDHAQSTIPFTLFTIGHCERYKRVVEEGTDLFRMRTFFVTLDLLNLISKFSKKTAQEVGRPVVDMHNICI